MKVAKNFEGRLDLTVVWETLPWEMLVEGPEPQKCSMVLSTYSLPGS